MIRVRDRIHGMDVQSVRQTNAKSVLRALRSCGRLRRKEIAEITNLSTATVSRVVSELISSNLVVEVETHSNGSVGRNSAMLDINGSGGWVLAVDIGSSHISTTAIDLAGYVKETLTRPLRNVVGEELFAPAVLSAIRDATEALSPKIGKPMAIGISCCGTIDTSRGMIKLSFNLGLENYPVGPLVQNAFGFPVVVINNIAASAFAELKRGHGLDRQFFAYVAIGVGIGASLVFNGSILTGENDEEGEFGLMVAAQEGDPERLHGRGYLEAISSGRGIASSARRAMEAGAESILGDLSGGNPTAITAEMVAEAADKGDAVAIGIMSRAAECLGVAIVNVAHLTKLNLFIVYGGPSKAGEVFWKPLREAVDRFAYWPGQIRLEKSLVEGDTALLGAGLFALDRVFDHANRNN